MALYSSCDCFLDDSGRVLQGLGNMQKAAEGLSVRRVVEIGAPTCGRAPCWGGGLFWREPVQITERPHLNHVRPNTKTLKGDDWHEDGSAGLLGKLASGRARYVVRLEAISSVTTCATISGC